jgi:lipopolysaccharide export system protein LptA
MIEGREMIFLLDKDRFVVNERVRMKIYPKDEEAKKTPEKKKSKLTNKNQLPSPK